MSLLIYYNIGIGLALLMAILFFLILVQMRKNRDIQVQGASLSEEVLEDHARTIAREHTVSARLNAKNRPVTRMNEHYHSILSVCQELNDDVTQKRTVPPAAEWLLDNFYIVEEQVKSVRRDLKRREYNDLPVLNKGAFKGYARIFAIAMEFVSHTDGQVETGTLLNYLEAYQSHTVLTEREISIIPIMLKLALLENIRVISDKIKETKRQWNQADGLFEKWQAEETDHAEKIIQLWNSNIAAGNEANPSFIEHLFFQLRRSGRSYSSVLHLIDEQLDKFHTTTEEIAQKEHNVQAVYAVSMGNCIVSLKYISSFDWSEIFEEVSLLERILRQDPDQTYQRMDISSRNYYKRQVGMLAELYQVSELHIAQEAVALAIEAEETAAGHFGQDKRRTCHVGYYLLGNGLSLLEERQKGEKTYGGMTKDFFSKQLGTIYMIFILACTVLITLGAALYAGSFDEGAEGVALAVLAAATVIIPASELTVIIANWLVCKVKKPAFFPRLELKDGIPEEMSTVVVIPALITDEKRVEQLLENIECHYLANREKHLYFALLGAFKDADGPNHVNDSNVLQAASRGIQQLNMKYGKDGEERFYFYHRLRKYNEKDHQWTGWERKRGALMEFNEMLLGSQETSLIFYSSNRLPADHIKYVITLDADTVLPIGMAAKMIGTIAHPLNTPYVDSKKGIVTEGYGILQPRITFDIESANRTVFSRIYTGQEGIDPYASAISDVYQDLFGEGIFTGKGIYDLRAFQEVLKDAFPENAILSHDLLEGSYARAALVSDLELVDSYPAKYNSYMARLHRWIRGDWQLVPWLKGRVYNRNHVLVPNPLSYVSIWKIADNLRRSLMAPSELLLILLGFSVLSGNGNVWAGFAIVVLGLPLVFNFFGQLCKRLKYGRIKRYMPGFFGLKSSLFQFLLSIVFLPYQAVRALDAVVVTLYRVLVSKRNMLEWVTSADVEKSQDGSLAGFWSDMGVSTLFGLAAAVLAYLFQPESFLISLVFLVVWTGSPYLAYRISKEDEGTAEPLQQDDLIDLRRITRKTWRYFEEFANAKNNYLIPDNYQEEPLRGVAYRTSPTNIGLGLLAVLSARDMGYIGMKEMIESLSNTVETIEKMEKWNGHLFNWYDTRTLEPLHPFYVSTVDSGNFVCYLITLIEGLKGYYSAPLIDGAFARGMQDTLRSGLQDREELPSECGGLELIGKLDFVDLATWNRVLDEVIRGELSSCIQKPEWKAKFEKSVRKLKEEFNTFFPWAMLIESMPEVLLSGELKEKANVLIDLMAANSPLTELPDLRKKIVKQIDDMNKCAARIKGVPQEGYLWMNQVVESVMKSDQLCRSFVNQYLELIGRIERLSSEISFQPFYNEARQLFSIGYNVDEKKLTNSYYDLLASEARQASYIAIARGEVPPKHWFMMGRLLTVVDHYKGLVSWSGTMFEYLMPLLLMKSYRNTLLDETYSFVIKSQQKYGRARNMPWGASESSFYSLDINLDYQYKAIGVPWLGLKRGLVEDAVTAPYATFLALMVSPAEAYQNIRYLKAEGLEGPYGFYEAADYTPERMNAQTKKMIIKSFMAHHQGMSLLALTNYLNHNVMQNRFSADPSVNAARLLLQEKVPANILFTKDRKEKVLNSKAKIDRDRCAYRKFTAPDFSLPKVHVLSNGSYSVMLTDKGTGYSRNKTVDISRWREDSVLDSYGMFFFVKNSSENQIWSAAYTPGNKLPEKYEVVFTPDKATYLRTDGKIETQTEIIVTSDDQAEIRKISLKNNGKEPCVIEVTSYFEVVLASRGSDLAHPAFSNLFVRTEYDQNHHALLANRRPRGAEEKEIWIAEIPVINGETAGEIEVETDRMQFIGRGHTIFHPLTIERGRPLTNTTGPVLDPIFSFRIKVKIGPEDTSQISFVTMTSGSRESIMELVEKYQTIEACDAAFWLALTRSQVETKYMNIKAQEMELYQDMISDIIFISPHRRKNGRQISENRMGQSSLWLYGISGDRPIVLVVLETANEVGILYEVLRAHEYWRLKDLRVDLVIISDEENSYSNPLFSLITEIVYSNQTNCTVNRHHDVFVLNSSHLAREDLDLFHAVARMIFRGGSTMKEQVQADKEEAYQGLLFAVEEASDHVLDSFDDRTAPPDHSAFAGLPSEDDGWLQFFNGIGGFDHAGKEYVIKLENRQMTPAPWANIIANPEFGFMATEAGGGFSWSENSRENKLSPWSNDPVGDTPGEIIYVQEETGKPWSITPLPIRDDDLYLVRHGFGYTEFEHTCHGLTQKLTQFVPVKGTVKISLVSLRNLTPQDKSVTITYYVTPVLGVNPSETAMHLVSALNHESTLTVRNPYNREFADRILFMDSSEEERSVTGDRKEFFGLGEIDSPECLKRKQLSGTVGAGFNPCAAMQMKIEVKANETKEVVLLLGMASDSESVSEIVKKWKSPEAAKGALREAIAFWTDKLQIIQVETPDAAMNTLLNGWLLYQSITCRMWARSAFYQSGGAFGYRDQLQDALPAALLWPELTENQIMKHARRQFTEGDVLHWWHEPAGKGIRSRISDDYLWLPYVTAEYIRMTGNDEILNKEVPFIQAEPLQSHEDERYCQPETTSETASLYDHCTRAIENGLKFGEKGLPLIGGGDWNDGMNSVGIGGKGESVWLGWFLCSVFQKFIPICRKRGDCERADRYEALCDKIAEAIEEHGWDGNWYKRAFFDNGSSLGSMDNKECKIDSLAQTWAVISGRGDLDRAKKALESLEDYLVMKEEGLIKLLTPPFDEGDPDPGYIKGYVPGVRENGGQYTHAAIWVVMAFALLGDGDKASELFGLINPINHTRTDRECSIYKVEPYVMAADVYSAQPHTGRGGWTWYTGSAGWMYKVGVENILGLTKKGELLEINPCIPKKWTEFSIRYQYQDAKYQIKVQNPQNRNRGVSGITVDGEYREGNLIPLQSDGAMHFVEVFMGKSE